MRNNGREYRTLDLQFKAKEDGAESNYIVEGYASTFEPYVLLEEEGVEYKEIIDKNAFDDADLSDVVFRIDHEGRVYARTSAGTVKLDTDEHGLRISADLSRTASAREVYEDIRAGNYDKMSFAFIVDADTYDKETHTRVISRIGKVFDISPVSFPANPGTEITARAYFNGVIEMEKAERLLAERKERLKKSILKELIEGEMNHE